MWGMSLELPGAEDVCAADFPGSLCGQGSNPSNCNGPADSTKPRVATGAGLIYERRNVDSRSDSSLCRCDLPELKATKERHLDRALAFNCYCQSIWSRLPHRGPF